MPPVLTIPISIDEEWDTTIIGLRIRVPDNLWDGCTGSHLYKGQIAAFYFVDESERYFMLKL